MFPKDKAVERIRDKIRSITNPKAHCKHHQEVIQELNRLLIGWGQYFDRGCPSRIFGKINYYVGFRLYRYLMRKSQRRRFNTGNDTWYKFFRANGLVLLRKGKMARA
jgi:RNA-directed DNA polymerase